MSRQVFFVACFNALACSSSVRMVVSLDDAELESTDIIEIGDRHTSVYDAATRSKVEKMARVTNGYDFGYAGSVRHQLNHTNQTPAYDSVLHSRPLDVTSGAIESLKLKSSAIGERLWQRLTSTRAGSLLEHHIPKKANYKKMTMGKFIFLVSLFCAALFCCCGCVEMQLRKVRNQRSAEQKESLNIRATEYNTPEAQFALGALGLFASRGKDAKEKACAPEVLRASIANANGRAGGHYQRSYSPRSSETSSAN